MTVIVLGADDFRGKVVRAFEDFAPFWLVALDVGGCVSLSPTRNMRYCLHPVGSNLLSDLVGCDKKIIVEYAKGKMSGYDDACDPGVWAQPADGRITWDWEFSENPDGHDECGDERRHPSVALAHEMIHALRRTCMGIEVGPFPDNEFETVCGENQIRSEMCKPRQVKYASYPVDCATIGTVLRTEVPQEYQCSRWSCLLVRVLKRLCAVRSKWCY